MRQAVGLVYDDKTHQIFETEEELKNLPKIFGSQSTYIYKELFPTVEKETVSNRTWNNMSKDEQKIYSFSYYIGNTRRFTKEKFSLKYVAKPI